jgi:hypothetical protein
MRWEVESAKPLAMPVSIYPDPVVVANQVETCFRFCRGQSLNGASFTAVEQLQEHIDAFIATYNETAEPFVWTGPPAAVQKSPYHSTLIPGTTGRRVANS